MAEKKKKFIPITNLENLTDEQKREYKINACEYFGVPPELNLLEFMRLDSGDGGWHLVLYAKKGATDIMREREGISVDEVKETIGDGFIMFTAKGHDKNGRTDVAVGAAETKNRTGKALSDAIMTAQTRATRRLTLQFVGGGLLDESEVQSTTTNINTTTQPLAEIAAPPILSPNPAPGRDITLEKAIQKAPEEEIAKKTLEVISTPTEPGKYIFVYDPSAPEVEGAHVATISPDQTAPKKRRRRKSSEVVLDGGLTPDPLDAPMPAAIFSSDPPFNVEPRPSAAQQAAAEALTKVSPTKLAEAAAAVPEASATHFKTCLTCNVTVLSDGGINKNADMTPHICPVPLKVGDKIIGLDNQVHTVIEAAPVVLKDQPNEKQKKEFKERLFNYTNNVLRQGKMIPCEGIGGVEHKVRAFVRVMFSEAKEVKFLTVSQWETFLGYMDEKLKELGAEGLVKLINEKIGAKE